MAKRVLVVSMKRYIQPFERELALRELRAVAKATPRLERSGNGAAPIFRVSTSRTIRQIADELTYWETVSSLRSGRTEYTLQVRREGTADSGRNGNGSPQLGLALSGVVLHTHVPNRRVLRYGPHGVHEYRGKFFPQLVRSLINVAGAKRGDHVLDPMCGSGTTLVEAVLSGNRALGADLNPLSVLMSRTKCGVLALGRECLAQAYEELRRSVSRASPKAESLDWLESLPPEDQKYLGQWFSRDVLQRLDSIAVRIRAVQHRSCRDLFWLSLSNILRRVSWQKQDDLRVRRDVASAADMDPVEEFTADLDKAARTMMAFLQAERPRTLGAFAVLESDARRLAGHESMRRLVGTIRLIVTSPPYATALPYLDTDRLSLSYLGLLSRRVQRRRDYEMIGNREVTKRLLGAYWSEYQRSRDTLPEDVTNLIDHIHGLNRMASVGFRRKNLSALLARYFLDMRDVFRGMATLLAAGAHAFVVIGNSHTVAGNERVEIETDRLLGLVGQTAGLQHCESLGMEMLVSRDIFRRNAIRSETILFFRKRKR